jgi:hypothetical protein
VTAQPFSTLFTFSAMATINGKYGFSSFFARQAEQLGSNLLA